MREEARAGAHRREDVADEIAYVEMPGIPVNSAPITRSLSEDKAYWTGISRGMQLLMSYGCTPERVAQVHRQAALELIKIERMKNDS